MMDNTIRISTRVYPTLWFIALLERGVEIGERFTKLLEALRGEAFRQALEWDDDRTVNQPLFKTV